MRGFGVTSVSFATETHMSRIADVLGLDPYEVRLKNANRIGDTSPNRIVYTDPSTVPVVKALAGGMGVELAPEYCGDGPRHSARATSCPSTLVDQLADPEDH